VQVMSVNGRVMIISVGAGEPKSVLWMRYFYKQLENELTPMALFPPSVVASTH